MDYSMMKSVPIDRVLSILRKFTAHFRAPVVDLIEFQTRDPFKVLVTTILSARTQDQTTLLAAKRLFEAASTPQALSKLPLAQIRKRIFPVGFYKTKAKHLKQLPTVLQELFDGKIPSTVEELVQLPGVGRKTANLVMAVGFQKPAVCVDVHVHRIMNRLGYVQTSSPLETEFALRKKLPQKYWITFNSILVAFGQNHCRPINPYCSVCPVLRYCNRIGVEKSK